MKALVREALKDPLNERFVLMSESCIPLVPFQKWKSTMFSHDKSIVNACPMGDGAMEENRWHSDLDKTPLKIKDWRKSANWFALNRKHATIFVEETETESAWAHVMCCDEHYLPTILAWKGLENETTCSDGFAYVYWPSSSAMHPTTFTGSVINKSFLRKLERPIEVHFTSSLFSQICSGFEEVCHFTARKFAPSSKIALLLHMHYLLDDENIPYTGYQWGKYVQRFRKTFSETEGERYYIIDWGEIRAIPDDATARAIFSMVRIHESKFEIPFLSDADRAENAESSPYPSRRDGLLYKVHRNNEVWYMKHGYRHSVPDWDTLQAMGFSGGDIAPISAGDLDLIPVGAPLPHLDYP
jgi:hypothetical protein